MFKEKAALYFLVKVAHPPRLTSDVYEVNSMAEAVATSGGKVETVKFGRNRYSAGMYRLDLSSAKDLPLKMNGEPSTFGALYSKLVESKIREMPDRLVFKSEKYVTEAGDIEVEGEWTTLSTMRTLVDLVRQDINPYGVMWFYYDTDWSRDADECHVFFAVHGDKVVLEACHFSSEEPLILKQDKDDDPIWHSHPYFDEAIVHYWYRRFYSETMTGKLMTLRPDVPILYFHERPTVRDTVKDLGFVTLVKTYRLLWVAVALLVAIAFPAIKEIMAIVAGALLIDVLWRCWALRKVGQDD
jgi:hypothetical protein